MQEINNPIVFGNNYTIIEQIGIGGMGTVYSAFDNKLKRKVAIKNLNLLDKENKENLIYLFKREAIAIAKLNHSNIVNVYDIGQEDENNYYTGQLCVIDNNGERREIRTMINEKGVYDKTNPVRIELRDNSTLWLVAGWEGGNDFIGNLFCDKRRRGICNIQRQDNYYGEINLYKFKEEDNV